MIEVSFYHLTGRTVDSALQALLERTRGRGWRAVVPADQSQAGQGRDPQGPGDAGVENNPSFVPFQGPQAGESPSQGG